MFDTFSKIYSADEGNKFNIIQSCTKQNVHKCEFAFSEIQLILSSGRLTF